MPHLTTSPERVMNTTTPMANTSINLEKHHPKQQVLADLKSGKDAWNNIPTTRDRVPAPTSAAPKLGKDAFHCVPNPTSAARRSRTQNPASTIQPAAQSSLIKPDQAPLRITTPPPLPSPHALYPDLAAKKTAQRLAVVAKAKPLTTDPAILVPARHLVLALARA